MRIGLISDTHGLLRPKAVQALQGCEHIIHGGDIGSPEVLEALRTIAPLTVVRGNNDVQPWAREIPEVVEIELAGIRICVIHDVKELANAGESQVVVAGHSHRPSVQERAGVLYVNPGSAGPRRFKLPVSVAELRLTGGQVSAEILRLEV